MKKSISILLAFSLMVSFFVTNASANENAETENIQLGDYVQFGTYLGEPILWRYVISDENGKMLISDKQLSMKCYSGGTNQKKAWDGEVSYDEVTWGNNRWDISDIRSWLNSTASAGEVEWLDGTAPDEDASFRGYNPYDDETGFLSANNFSENDLKLIKTVQLKTYDKENIITNIEDYRYISDIEIDLNDVDYTTTEDKIFLPDLVEIKKIYDNSNVLGEHYCYAPASEKAVEHHGTSYGSIEWDIWLRCPDYESLNTEYDEGTTWVSTLCKGESYQDGVSQCVVYGIGGRASCGSDLTGIRPAFYLEDEFEIRSGDGTSDSPYILSVPAEAILIYNESDLKQVTSGNNYKLMADIELTEPWTPIERFVGSFDGNGFKITNIQCPADWSGENYGLFSAIVDSKVSNLTVSGNITVSGNNEITRLGLIAGFNDSSTVNNCTATGNIQISDPFSNYWYEDIGGLFGMSLYASITNCTNECSVNADCENAGGIVGNTGFETTISQCKNIANITGGRTGGITALTDSKTTIELSYNIGNISTTSDSGAGGIVGESNGSIYNCYNAGDIANEHWCAGGIIAYDMSNMFNVYNIGAVSANGDFGAIDGFTDICYDSSTWYYLNNEAIEGVGNNYSPSNQDASISLSQEQMKQKESFPTFDFETVWDINPEINDGYPYLRCFYEETTDAKFGISSVEDGVAGSWFSFDVEFSSLPTSAYLQFDAPDDNWNWLSEEYCMNHETFKIPVEDLKEENGKYIGTVTLIIYSTGNPDDSYNRAVRINADFAGEKKQSEVVKIKVEPILEKPNRSFGNLYEQTSEPLEIDTYPQILSVLVQKLNGQYLLEVSSYIAEDKENVFFYWETDNGEFTGTSTKYDVAKLNAPEGATVTVTMGDGYGYISTKTIELPAID